MDFVDAAGRTYDLESVLPRIAGDPEARDALLAHVEATTARLPSLIVPVGTRPRPDHRAAWDQLTSQPQDASGFWTFDGFKQAIVDAGRREWPMFPFAGEFGGEAGRANRRACGLEIVPDVRVPRTTPPTGYVLDGLAAFWDDTDERTQTS